MKHFFEANNVVLLKADKTTEAPEVDALLHELGNKLAAIPYYGLFQPGEDPIHFNGVYLTADAFLDQLGADQLAEAWRRSGENMVDLKEAPRTDRVTRLPGAAAAN